MRCPWACLCPSRRETQHLESQLREEVEMKMRLHKVCLCVCTFVCVCVCVRARVCATVFLCRSVNRFCGVEHALSCLTVQLTSRLAFALSVLPVCLLATVCLCVCVCVCERARVCVRVRT